MYNRKCVKIVGFFLICLCLSGFSFKNLPNPLYDNIKTQAQGSLKYLFHREVKIGSVGGKILGEIILKDVKISPDLEAPVVKINFNLAQYLKNKGDIVPAITSIIVERGRARVKRDKNNNINMVDLFVDPKAQSSAPPALPLNAKIILLNCKASYEDHAGIYGEKISAPYLFNFEISRGTLELLQPADLKFSVKASQNNSPVAIEGNFNIRSLKYQINLSAQNLDIKKWGPFAVPLALDYKSGSASLKLGLVNDRLKIESRGIFNGSSFSASGTLNDFNNLKLAFKVNTQSSDLSEIKSIFPQFKNIDFSGRGDSQINIEGPINSLSYNINLNVTSGLFYRQPIFGKAQLVYKNKMLTLLSSRTISCKGIIASSGWIDFNYPIPKIKFNVKPSSLNLVLLSYKTPGISGLMSGDLNISGNLEDLEGELKATFRQAEALGQPIENGNVAFSYYKKNMLLKILSITSKDSYFKSSGSINSDSNALLSAEASGILLKGENFIGPLKALIKNFNGSLAFKLDNEFFSAPIRNISASGSIEVAEGQIGEQIIDQGIGDILLEKGRLKVKQFLLRRNNSTIYLSGETGINVPSGLKIIGQNINLEDVKILNLGLPPIAKDPQGIVNIDIQVSGRIDQETNLTSLDPILKLNYIGSLSLVSGEISGVEIKKVNGDFEYNDGKLSIRQAAFQGSFSSLKFTFSEEEDQIKLNGEGSVNFKDFNSYLAQYGYFEGIGDFKVACSGEITNPKVNLSLNFDKFVWDDLYVGKIKTELIHENKKILFKQPLEIESETEKYELGGDCTIKEDIPSSLLNLELKIERSSIKKIIPLLIKLGDILNARGKAGELLSFAIRPIDLPKINNYLTDDEVLLFSYQKEHYLKDWSALEATYKSYKKEQLPKFWNDLEGNLRAGIKITGKVSQPEVAFGTRLDDFSYRGYKLDGIDIQGKYFDNIATVNRAEFVKNGGSILIWGVFDPKGNKNNLAAKTNNMPIDVLELLLGKKGYEGNFNLSASLSGKTTKPNASIKFIANEIKLAGIKYDQISAEAVLAENHLHLKYAEAKSSHSTSKIRGDFSFADNSLDCSAIISNEGLGLINLFNDDLHYIEGSCNSKLHFYSYLENLNVDGFLSINNAAFNLPKLNSRLTNANLELKAFKNLISIPNINGYWIGKATRFKPNSIALAIRYDLNSSALSAAARDTHLDLDFEGSYIGEVETKNITLAGHSGEFLLSGNLNFNDGIIYLPEKGKGGGMSFGQPLNLDMNLDFSKNMYLTAGNVSTLDLSNLFLNLEFTGGGLKINGKSNEPQLAGRLDFKRGTVTVFNREFDLLSEGDQAKYYPYDYDKTSNNYAQFSKEFGLMPYLNLSAVVNVEAAKDKTTVENKAVIEDDKTKKKETNIIAHLKGIPEAKESDRGLKIDFEAFEEDKSYSPPVIVKAAYSDSEIKGMLLPDFFKSLIGGEKVDSSALLSDYLESRIQILVFRDFERKMEKALGLESLTLQYNFGKDIRRNLGVTESGEIRPLFGFAFVKGFFDRLFVEIKYSQEEQSTETSGRTLNYQITLRFSPWTSMAYYREPLTYTGVDTSYYKVTLKTGFPI